MIEAAGKPAIQSNGVVIGNDRVARDTFRIRIRAPEIARRILPGQFVMARSPDRTDPLLARPFALYDVIDDDDGQPNAIDLVYLVLGPGTRTLATLTAGQRVALWGPLGNTFPIDLTAEAADHLWLVAGGIGQTPFLAVINELLGSRRYGDGRTARRPRRVTFAYGVRGAEYFALLDDFRATGAEVRLATDDGSAGRQGRVTDLVADAFQSDDPPTAFFGCGPEPMLEALANLAASRRTPCWVSLETKMACGYGVCFSCVFPVVEPEGWDYRRVCLAGPVFPAAELVWLDRAASPAACAVAAR